MPYYTIHCVGFDHTQQASIAAILDLADSALSHSWSIIENTDSDIVMINMQEEEAQQLVAKYNSLAEYRLMLVAENSQESFQNYWFLEKKEQAPPSLRVLVDLLNQVGICLDEAAASMVEANHEEPVEVVANDVPDAVDLPVPVVEPELLDTQTELEDELPDAQESSELEDELPDAQENSELEDELSDAQENSELEDELSDAQENSELEDELLDVQESSELEDELSDAQENSELEDELPDAQESSELEDELSDAQENSELEDELPDAQESSELEDELSDAQENSELEDELLDVQESSELEDELSDAQESSELEDELSDAQENSELEDELFDVQESSELEDELFDVQESSELEDELSDAQENSGLENELLDVQESSELEDELLDVQESSELEDELSDAQENSELEDELSDVQENSELEDESVKVAVDLVDDGANVKHEKIEKPQRKLSVENYFFGLLLEANKEKKYRIIKLNTLPALYLAPEDSCYYFSGTEEELLQYCLVMPKNLNVKVLPRAKFNKALKSESSELQQKDFKSLISYAVIHVSQGQLLDGHSAKQGLVLSSMPDVEKNSILSRYKGIAEHMYQQEGSLFDVAETLQVSLADVFDFYNLCYLLGYVKMTTTDAKDLETDNTKTLGRFLKSFFTK